MTTVWTISPLNDFVKEVYLEKVDAVTGLTSPVIPADGTPIGFIASSNDPAAVALTGLQVNLVYIGGANGFADGTWQCLIDASVLIVATLDPPFVAGGLTPYLILVHTNNVRQYVKLKYLRSKPAVQA
jgi:hypothetical protein